MPAAVFTFRFLSHLTDSINLTKVDDNTDILNLECMFELFIAGDIVESMLCGEKITTSCNFNYLRDPSLFKHTFQIVINYARIHINQSLT